MMPGFDGTGPLGRGSMTGRGGGWCVVEVEGRESTRGVGNGCRGMRHGYRAGLGGRGRMAGMRANSGWMENENLIEKVVETLESISQNLDRIAPTTEHPNKEVSA